MSERIAAESHGPVLGVLEDLLACCPCIESLRESHFEVIDMDVQMHWRPMMFVVARLSGASGSLRACAFLEQADVSIAGAEYDHTRNGFGELRESEGTSVEPNCLREIRHDDANG